MLVSFLGDCNVNVLGPEKVRNVSTNKLEAADYLHNRPTNEDRCMVCTLRLPEVNNLQLTGEREFYQSQAEEQNQ